MDKVTRLLNAYERFIALPWKPDSAADQRVIFCVYDPRDELSLRARTDEFEIATRKANHGWRLFDLTDTFALWLSKNRYVRSYFSRPEIAQTLNATYLAFIVDEYRRFILEQGIGENDVVALGGVASLFGLLKVKDVVDKVAKLTTGRLTVFFPGSFDNDNYRLLDAYDGWNYLAVPITAETRL
ncbi:MAG TPA: DUF1788 domain-containing protein [Spirochaetia bacterium]|nr:DUF1788 domain-containing protein [Spirochaetia bacterium]